MSEFFDGKICSEIGPIESDPRLRVCYHLFCRPTIKQPTYVHGKKCQNRKYTILFIAGPKSYDPSSNLPAVFPALFFSFYI